MSNANLIPITSDNWKAEVLDSPIPVLVDFWAEWCGPCRALTPVLEDLATETAGKMKIVKVNVDENQSVAAQFGIRSIPTMLVFVNGVVKGQMIGAMNKTTLKDKLANYL